MISSDNKLIFGDNLLALKALEAEYTGKVNVFISTRRITSNAFKHDDGPIAFYLARPVRDRLELLKRLLREDEVFYMQLNDNEIHYAKDVI